MPGNAPIVIKDGMPTPVDRTFSPIGIDSNNVASFKERKGDTAFGWPTLTIGYRGPVKGGVGTHKVAIKLVVPTVVTTTDSTGNPVVSVTHTSMGSIDIVVSEKSTAQDRKNLRVLLANALLATSPSAVIDGLESFW